MKHLFKFLLNVIKFIKYEFDKNRSLGLPYLYKAWKDGFLTISHLLYDFRKNDKSFYLSDWKRIHLTSKLNGSKKLTLDDKLIFHLMNVGNEHVLPLIAVIRDKKILAFRENTFTIIEKADFLNLTKTFKNGIIVKPTTGGGGAGISKISYENQLLTFSGACKGIEDFTKVIESGKEYLITEIIVQTGVSHKIYPYSINSIRVLTMVDPVTNVPFIAAAVHRFGVRSSGLVDNWSAGGISVKLDYSTGVLGMGAKYPNISGLEWMSSHSETKVRFEDVKVDNWDFIRDSILKMAAKYSFLPYVGWDIVPMEQGFYILEGNNNSDVNLLQIHGGLMADEKVKEFFNYHGIV